MASNPAIARMIGERLRAIRKESGDNLQYFIGRMKAGGLIVPKRNRYENGKECPSTEKIIDICEHLKISADWLLLGFVHSAHDLKALAISGLVQLVQEQKPRPIKKIEAVIKHYEQQENPRSADVSNVSEKTAGFSRKNPSLSISISPPRNRRDSSRSKKK